MIPLKDNIPTGKFPVITVALIAINIAVFAWQLSFSGDNYSSPPLRDLGITERDQNSIEYGAIPYRIVHPGRDCAAEVDETTSRGPEASVVCEGTTDYTDAESSGKPFEPLDEAPWWETLISSMFMHGGLLHIAFNMLFLWIFGNNVEDAMGRVKFAVFYLAAGVAAVYAQAAIDPSSTVPTIGASGAVAGVLGGYALLHPQARVLTLIFIIFFVTLIEIPAMILLGIWFILQFLPAVGQAAITDVGEGGGVAYFAHVGGFVFGLLTIKLFADRHRRRENSTPYVAG